MMKFRSLSACLLLVAVCPIPFTAEAQPANPQETLKQYISDLQMSPNDFALREKIIRHVQSMKKAPATPEESRRYFIEGNALLKAAKNQEGYVLAIEAYRQCLLMAPWWAEANYNHAVALELASRFDEAINTLKLYIATNPGEAESRKTQDKIYEIGAKKIIAAREREESSPQAVAAREQNRFKEWLRSLDGRRYTSVSGVDTAIIDIKGNMFVQGWIGDPNYSGTRGYHELGGEIGRVEIKGRETTVQIFEHLSFLKVWAVSSTFLISEDGNSITARTRFSDGDTRDYNYHWQR